MVDEQGDTGMIAPPVVRVQSFMQLVAGGEWPLSVDTYQRGFVWQGTEVRKLLDDLSEHTKSADPMLPYYMGAVLLHRSASKQRRFVIDGQQRLTALSVLYHCLTQKAPANFALTYSPQSERYIRSAADACRDSGVKLDAKVFDRIAFTEISVDDVDLAFTFFDTQNNRGIQPHETDLLKAYHLRAIDGESEQKKLFLQKRCAMRWEKLQCEELPLMPSQEVVQLLFSRYLWRARHWTGQQKQAYEGDFNALLEEFKEASIHTDNAPNTIPLYVAHGNRRALALSWSAQDRCAQDQYHYELQTVPVTMSQQAADLPFAIRQPIHRGIGFFLYADKYASLLRWLMLEPRESTQRQRFREVFDTMVQATSPYLKESFLLASLMYVDRFGEEQLWEFSLWLEYVLGAVRVEKQQVRRETAQNFFCGDPIKNLLDVIVGAFTPNEVIRCIQTRDMQKRSDQAYEAEQIDASANGVQAIYKKSVLGYFAPTTSNSLRDKRTWIRDRLKKTTP